jgi:hypothetical protein
MSCCCTKQEQALQDSVLYDTTTTSMSCVLRVVASLAIKLDQRRHIYPQADSG